MESESTEQNVVLRGNEDLMSTSNTSTNDGTCNPNGCTKKTCITSPDPTAYVTKARVTRPTPPPPSKNPMQFVQIKPCNLYQTAQEQLKKAEEVKKLKEVKKEEPEEWQNNLDNWKSSRRKRVEHIIDRVVETKKLELEEHDRTRRKSKTFTEMMEERAERSGSRGRVKLASLAVYNDDETNDLSDLGIGTSSASGKSSLSEDYENNSVMSDNVELDKAIGTAAATNIQEQQNHINRNQVDVNVISQASTSNTSKLLAVSEATGVAAASREYTPMNTNPPSTADPCEYTYEGAIQDYKQRVQRASSNGRISNNNAVSETGETIGYPTRRGSKIEDRLSGFEVTSPSDTQEGVEKQKVDVPRVDISKRKEIFEQRDPEPKVTKPNGGAPKQKLILRDRLTNGNGAAVEPTAKQEIKRLSGDICSIRDRMQSLEQQRNEFNSSKSVDVAVPPLKQRLNSLQQHVVTKEEEQLQQKKPPLVALIDARQLEIMRGEEQRMRQQEQKEQQKLTTPPALIVEEAAHDDSGIQVDNNEELLKEQQQQQQLNEAIAALALEERQLEEAANAVNQIEAEFDELTDMQPIALPAANATATTTVTSSAPSTETSSTITAATQPEARDMEFSINEALDLALEAIDREANSAPEKIEDQEENNGESKLKLERLEDEHKEETKVGTMEMNAELEEMNTAMPNKTDEQKTVEEVVKQDIEGLEQQEQHMEINRNEPIYENIKSTISMQQVDIEQTANAMIIRRNDIRNIPNNSNNNNNNEHNQTNNNKSSNNNSSNCQIESNSKTTAADLEPYYQVPKATEPYYDAPKHLRPIPVYENIDIFYTGLELGHCVTSLVPALEPPKEKPPPPPTEEPLSEDINKVSLNAHDDELDTGTWSSDNTYETISSRSRHQLQGQTGLSMPTSPPIKRMNSTKRIKKELRNKRSSFLGIETDAGLDDVDSYLQLTVATPPDMSQLLQEERRLEKQLYIKAGLCDSSDTGESRDSGVSENHSRQSSEHYTNSSEENDTQSEATPPPTEELAPSQLVGEVLYQNKSLLAAQTPLLQTVKGTSAESWTESATAAAAATQSLSEATATANAKMLSIEEKIREQGEVLRVEQELLLFSKEELKRQRENLLLRENLARRELQHGAKMLMSNNRRSLQDLHHGLGIGNGMLSAFQPPQQSTQQIYANVPQQQQQQQQRSLPLAPYHYQQLDMDYRKSMSDLNEFSKRLMLPPTPPIKPLRAMHLSGNGHSQEPDYAVSARQRSTYGGSLVKIAPTATTTAPGAPAPRYQANPATYHHQSVQNLSNMSRNTLLALSATPKPKYTDGWVQVQQKQQQQQRNLINDGSWLQKHKSTPDYNGALYNSGHANHWLLQEAEHRRQFEQQQQQQQQLQLNRRSMPVPSANDKPLPDSVIQTLTERVQSKGIGERKRFDSNATYSQLSTNGLGFKPLSSNSSNNNNNNNININNSSSNNSNQEKMLSVSGKKKCSHCGDELGRGAAMIIESLLLFYHINCFKCCVCHVQLGDGLNGTDVRVRNHKLHCQNCYSSDDGIKFSCV
ncbi:FK506-binding protein 5 isoform X1 [Drosophila mojavensis]|uniref:FK506-binding protein 5 isoform X1 n=1 Tax=Drosophila mojavensis TaxID=7230 RepID=UPI0013EEA2E0|nr:FK506-binding protein 5 isoform X1 [Drosophila mojavensis]XP_032588883.1 FK506-binding protein 5 isoform X1 [Drosophila mojavensis]XP_032588890.1 FK506-binding protein 5 isoform X1 [Drosophila mojavensis]XP_032588892.1 FK506-binding protein 5 isoform X1 [Drosophila mojavensis]XP_043863767.1 FK506-binding protein 5 isoform X1 [Drosophila mojavensis]